MKTTIALLVALSGCIDSAEQLDLDNTEQALDGQTRDRVFTIAGGTALSRVQATAGSLTYAPTESVGGSQLQKLATERNQDGRLNLFAIGGDGALYGRYQTTGGGWNPEGWQSMGGGWIVQVVTARNSDGRIEVFVRNVWGNVFHRYQVTPNGGWNPEGWLPFGGDALITMDATLRGDGRIEVVAIGGDNHMYRRAQYVPNSGWNDWSLAGGSNLTSVAVAQGYAGMQVVAIDTNGNLEGATEDGTSTWGAFSVMANGHMSQAVMYRTYGGRLDILAIDPAGTCYELQQAFVTYRWNTTYNFLDWTNVAQLAVAMDRSGAEQAFARNRDGSTSFAFTSTPLVQPVVWGSMSSLPLAGTATDVVAIDQQ